jgi:hypothetical protein
LSPVTPPATGFAIYPGTDTQSPDARMQATLGVANTPAFRGLAYIVFYDFQLAKYGNSLAGAQVRVEILQLGATYTYPYTSFTQPNRYWRRPAWDGTVYCSFAYFHNSVVVSADGLSWTQYTAGTNTSGNQGCASNGAGTLLAYGTGAGTNMLYSLDHGHTWSSASLSGFNGYVTQVEWNGSYFLAITDTGPFFTSSNGIAWTSHTPPGSGNFSHSLCWHPGSSKWYVCTQFGTDPTIYASPNAATGTWSVAYTLTGDLNNFSFSCVHNGRIIFNGIGTGDLGYQPMNVWSDDGVTWNRKNVPMYQYYIFSDGTNCWCGDTNGQMYYSADGVFNWTRWDGPLQAVNHEASYANGFIVCMGQNGVNGYRISKRFVSSLQPTLGSIVSAECLQSSLLTAYDIDVTALTSTVKGYRNGSVGPVRSALEPLQVAWPFDVVQRGYKVKFLPRGGASIATIPASDLDARSAGGAPGVRITSARAGDSDLPKRLSLHYMNVDREYGIDEQYAERGALA